MVLKQIVVHSGIFAFDRGVGARPTMFDLVRLGIRTDFIKIFKLLFPVLLLFHLSLFDYFRIDLRQCTHLNPISIYKLCWRLILIKITEMVTYYWALSLLTFT